MRFDNIIHRQVRYEYIASDEDVDDNSAQVGDTTYEAADWIVEGFDRGSYFNAARGGKVIWDIATT